MARKEGQKLKLYYLAKIMIEKTDEEHMITMPEIIAFLESYGISADRKSIYTDIKDLEKFGIEVNMEKERRGCYYHVTNKEFQVAELKLLVDAIQSSKFITEKKSNELIGKLTGLVSQYEASELKRQVVVRGRVKTMNESIYYSVDDLHNAIASDKKISFEYMQWDESKKLVPRREEPYIVSPWALTWSDENYYLIAYDEDEEVIKHFRVDKMKNVDFVEGKRAGKGEFKKFDLAKYSKMNFGMFGGEESSVRIAFKKELVGVFIDRFGKDIPIYDFGNGEWIETSVDVALSDQFYGWIFALGSRVKIKSPKKVVELFKDELSNVMSLYDNE